MERNRGQSGAGGSQLFTGIGVSAGIVIGKALLVGREYPQVTERSVVGSEVPSEKQRFRDSLDLSRQQIQELKARVADMLGEKDASIFDAHMLLLGDKALLEEVHNGIAQQGRNAEFIFSQVIDRYARALQAVPDSYIRDRILDIRDVAARVIRNLQGEGPTDLAHLEGERILVAHDLSPSDTASMDRQNVIAFATCVGSRTSHTAIMARSLGIPAVVGVCGVMDTIKSGDEVILDGYHGTLCVKPTAAHLEDSRKQMRAQEEWLRNIEAEASLPAETQDSFRVQLAANIELAEEVDVVRRTAGVGIGLFRTEYLFMNQAVLPDEERQVAAYRRVVQGIYPQSVIIRTLDIGGDKFLSHLNLPSELNPFLGIRAIRFCLSQPDIFMTQLRAILRASAFGKVRIMFPMIATMEELQQALTHLKLARAELDAKGIAYNHHLDVGIMIEVPAAAMMADQLAKHVDFFSIGTNDLIQYSLAADRSNPATSYLYQPTHPAIIRLLRQVVHAATQQGIWVSVCGEMAGDPLYTPLILGLGLQELSMSVHAIGPIKRLVRRLKMHDAEDLVRKAMFCTTAEEVRAMCEELVCRVAPEVLGEEGRPAAQKANCDCAC